MAAGAQPDRAAPRRSGRRYAAKGQPAAQCSTGEQKALLISLVLANARALAADHRRAAGPAAGRGRGAS
jgi:recombinational DNA repair ATPase RecF